MTNRFKETFYITDHSERLLSNASFSDFNLPPLFMRRIIESFGVVGKVGQKNQKLNRTVEPNRTEPILN